MNNKYIPHLFLVISLSIMIPNVTLATQGACSYHDGVDCSVTSYEGKVTCNDGWVNSSVYFSDVNECKTSTESLCVYPSGYTSNISTCDEMQKTCDNYNSLMKTAGARTGSDYVEKPCDEAISCREEVGIYNKMLSRYDECGELEMKRLEFYYQNRLDEQNRKSEEQFQKLKQEEKLMNDNKKLQTEIDKLKSEEYSRKIIEEALDVSGRITTPSKPTKDLSYNSFLKEKQKKEQAKKSEKGMFDDIFLPSQQTTLGPTQIISEQSVIETTIAPSHKKNVFINIFEKFMGLFK